MALKILVFSLLVSGISSQCTLEKATPFFKRSVFEFSIDLVRRVAEETDNHFVMSALSPWTLLSTVSLGATDETLMELKRVLRLHPHKCFNDKFFKIIKEINSKQEGTVLERSSTAFIDDKFPLNDVFTSRVEKAEVCNLAPIPFNDFYATANQINNYVKTATHGTIEDIVEPNDLAGVYVILIDALYFKGTWKNEFLAEDTETSTFYDEREAPIGDVSLMFNIQTANIVNVKEIGATVLELKYSGSERFSMLFILPDTGKTVTSVIEHLSQKKISLSSIFILFKKYGESKVQVQIPKFKMASDVDNLKELLIDMGLKTLFDARQARLSDMAEYELYISNILQKATIEVNEVGTEASVITEALFEGRSFEALEQFTANRPFLYMIVDREIEVALFTGAYSKPSEYDGFK